MKYQRTDEIPVSNKVLRLLSEYQVCTRTIKILKFKEDKFLEEQKTKKAYQSTMNLPKTIYMLEYQNGPETGLDTWNIEE